MAIDERNVFGASLLSLVLLFPPCTARSQESDFSLPEPEILPKCIESIAGNYAKLTTIRAKLYWVLLDPKVDKEQVKQFDLPGGGSITVTESPRTSDRVKFTSKGSDYRHERSDGTIFIRKGEALTEVIDKTVHTRKLSECPGYGTLDPREFGGTGFHRGLLDLLKKSKLLSSKSNDNGTIEIRTEIESSIKGMPAHRYDCTLDRNRNWVPTRVISYLDDGLIASYTEFDYEEVLPKVWFMKRVTTNFAGTFKIAEIKPDVAWSQTQLVYTFGKPEFNIPISDKELASTSTSKSPNE